ncbi:NAD(P)H-hydrate dehydratase [Sphingomonas sp. PL-96]|uniref:NAD(P)H-hydrate dehydratase n=1 Tax=Sphingomonas sp. PL-96 TaxID=2887201 RepID=UPI001E3DA543|nr:NAD(P)H-hydrate dehydratase [Sphingomonas sp. PL-96]MCC2976115.1 NAD(P)H-hydrate dehydratase [Sphingomonas sp. PL-96]
MSTPTPIDSGWLAAHPLPVHGEGTTKNSRGRVLAVGGSRRVPGGLLLTGEAALRVGAGKLMLATIASAAPLLGVAMPEAGVTGLAEDEAGEIAGDGNALAEETRRCDTIVLGPAMSERDAAVRLVEQLLADPPKDAALVLDAAAVACAGPFADRLKASFGGRLVLTPHLGEMAALCGCDAEEIDKDREGAALATAKRFGAVLVLKDSSTLVATPDGDPLLRYEGGGVGLATGGSGDVLAGAIAGLLSRGAAPVVAAGWGVWLHGEAGRALAMSAGPLGFLGRELPPQLPRLLPR